MKNGTVSRLKMLVNNNLVSIFLLAVVLINLSSPAKAQTETILVTGDIYPGEGNLNRAIKEIIKSGNLSNTEFKLRLNSRYILNETITIPAGSRLILKADEPGQTQETAPPQILWSSKDGINRNIIFDCYGDITLKNIWILYATTDGSQTGSTIQIRQAPGVVSKGEEAFFENVIFDYSSIPFDGSGAVCVTAKHFRGAFKNCYFKNCGDKHYRYYGRAVSFPFASQGWHIDYLTFENCTFANIGYVYMQEGGGYADNVIFNHCTFLNVVMYCLESGWWYKLSVNNSLFVNTYMYGDQPIFSKDGVGPDGGTIRIDSIASFGFNVPFTEQERQILFTHSSYYIEKWLSNWMSENPFSKIYRENKEYDYIPSPQPMLNNRTTGFFENVDQNGNKMFPLMNKTNLLDGLNPYLINPPGDTMKIKSYIARKWWDSSDEDWAYYPEDAFQYKWPMRENLAYTNSTLLKAAMGHFPLGDLYRWFPEKYAEWKAQQKLEDNRISIWLATGKDPGTVGVDEDTDALLPNEFKLFQNFPNPFNPSTTIQYKIPVVDALSSRRSAEVHVSLKIFDVLGREVAKLVDEVKAPGTYEVKFNAGHAELASRFGRGQTSGIYFYRLRCGEFIETRKMVLIK